MNGIKCIIVDDEPLARKILEDYISEIPSIESFGSFKSALDAHAFLEEKDIDLLFLDVQMPRLTGINWIRQMKQKPLIVLTTAYSEFAVEAFEIEALDFLVKPISFERMLAAVEKAKNKLQLTADSNADFISIKEGKRIYRIDSNSIIYLQAFGDYVRIITKEKTFITKERFQHIIEQLHSDFLQLHRSYVVNIKWVNYLEGNHVQIGDEKIPVSATFKMNVIAKLGT